MRSTLLSLLLGASGPIMLCTAQTPTLIKDINPSGASNVAHLTCIDGTVYFQASDGVHGAEIWKSDGTTNGTVMVKDLQPGADGSFPKDFMAVNGLIYFTTNDLSNGVRLWRTDGTENGTELALTLADVPGLLEWITFVPLGDRIFFRGQETTTGRELWSTDGTAGGTQLFMDIHPGTMNSGFQNPMAHDGKIYFSASDGTNGSEPWISDGTLAGTHMIAETIPGPGSSGTSPSNFTAAGGLVFFRAGTSATGDELWATDGTEAGTGVVRDIYPGSNSSLPSFLTEHNGAVYLRGFNFSGNYIWTSNGTTEGTVQLPIPANGYSLAENLCSHAGGLYFTGYNGTSRQLWRTDGTAEGTQEILLPGSDVAQPLDLSGPLRSCDGQLFFRANYTSSVGQELYTLNTSTAIDHSERPTVQLYPNPASDVLSLSGHHPDATLELHSTDGRVALSIPAAARMNISSLSPGMYVARIVDGAGGTVHQQKVLIEQ